MRTFFLLALRLKPFGKNPIPYYLENAKKNCRLNFDQVQCTWCTIKKTFGDILYGLQLEAFKERFIGDWVLQKGSYLIVPPCPYCPYSLRLLYGTDYRSL